MAFTMTLMTLSLSSRELILTQFTDIIVLTKARVRDETTIDRRDITATQQQTPSKTMVIELGRLSNQSENQHQINIGCDGSDQRWANRSLTEWPLFLSLFPFCRPLFGNRGPHYGLLHKRLIVLIISLPNSYKESHRNDETLNRLSNDRSITAYHIIYCKSRH